ncbi:MAG: di-trans,poly-cis-decaprenylcistransferase [Candidatus Magasanikbacteria bacterium CG10_big_fil_rev_8_21_14_0_10_43_6]|uniref:Isoprenyl transferase n=1 Tax=Candidatus Magasanikbacteria bacterium CG10_big_fil_rev_8_21_14_0_10_43_6 TaxID=1974650 RepID=A0A2M6VZU2_9BACT|nr:MAG: di-trans,poly-cis-decaprenylcistransferase [Candidatus Magasanikbacteria bacterium CG10_big_fil_rev_8_21_14_0_10_43_6]
MPHIAIILDGNRRWATERGLPKMVGHTEGAKNIRRIAKTAIASGVQYLTLYTLSTENLKNRSDSELKHLFTLFGRIVEFLDDLTKHNVRLNVIGDITGLPQKTQEYLARAVENTKDNTGMVLTLAANYGGRDEITRAVKHIVASGISPNDVDEAYIQSMLDTGDMPEVDMVIRTGGDQRLSNFLPWQCVYAQLYFTPVKWPAFSPTDLQHAIDWFFEQKRNRGK